MPASVSAEALKDEAYSHGRVKRAGGLMVALNAWTTSENLGNIELANCALGVVDLSSAGDGGCLCPIIWLFRQALSSKGATTAKYTKDCISIAESHRRRDWGHFQAGRQGLDDAGVETGSSRGDGERIVQSLAGGGSQA